MNTSSSATEKHYTVQEVAELWSISDQTVYRLFQDEEGVLKLSKPRPSVLGKRAPRVSLRIPASVLARVHEQRTRGFRREVELRRRGV